MKNILLVLFVILSSFESSARPRVFFNYYVFYNESNEPYVETALQFASGSLHFEGDSIGNLQAHVEITQLFKKGDLIVAVDKYNLSSPIMKDSTIDDFFDLKRFKMPPGNYDFELIVRDLYDSSSVSGSYNINVSSQNKGRIEMSDVEFVQNVSKSNTYDNFTKNGYQLIPYFTNYFPPDYTKMAYYLEFYNADKLVADGQVLAATFQVQSEKTGSFLESYFQYKKLKGASITPVINILPIEELPSGEYNLVINVVNQNNDTLVYKKIPFKRRNDLFVEAINVDINDLDGSFAKELESDSIYYYLNSLAPIAPRHEVDKIMRMLKTTDTNYVRQYFYSFWKETNPENPLRGWQDYKMQVQYVEELFGTQIKRGFEADRGRIHLQHGAPNYVTDQEVGTSAYPYQIWHYYKLEARNNVRFVFYNPDLVTNDFPLLHSDLPGEVQNQNWRQEIVKRTNGVDGNQTLRGNSGIYFDD